MDESIVAGRKGGILSRRRSGLGDRRHFAGCGVVRGLSVRQIRTASPYWRAFIQRMISLTIDQVTKRFGESIALNRIDLTIAPGEIFFLLGPSGCGKTTLLRSIAGFYIPEEGRILFGDEDVTRLPPHLRNTGMMFQSYALWPHLTVAQNVAFGLEERKVAAPEIEQRVRRSPGLGQDGTLRRAQDSSALRRPAAAGRLGAGPGDPAALSFAR